MKLPCLVHNNNFYTRIVQYEDETLWKHKFLRKYAKQHSCTCSKGNSIASLQRLVSCVCNVLHLYLILIECKGHNYGILIIISQNISLPPGSLSWKEEFRRLYFLAPWNGTQNMNNDLNTQGALEWYAKYKKEGVENQCHLQCPEIINNAHYGKVLCVE